VLRFSRKLVLAVIRFGGGLMPARNIRWQSVFVIVRFRCRAPV
jgi:hypothetical protein